MMAEAGHSDDNGESSFEFINGSGNQERLSEFQIPENANIGNISSTPNNALPNVSALQHSNTPTPPPLSAFSAPIPPSSNVSEPTPPQIPTPPKVGSAETSANPFSVRAAGTSLSSSLAHHLPPAVPSVPSAPTGATAMPLPTPPPIPPQPNVFSPPMAVSSGPPVSSQSSSSYGLEIPFEVSSQPNDPASPLSAQAGVSSSAGVWGWFNKTISNSDFLTKVAEKAKTSMDSMITTLDPQMKEYMDPNSALELIVITSDVELVGAVKDGFCRWFPQVIIRGVPPTYSSSLAAQTVGFENGLQGALEEIRNLRQSGHASPNTVIFAENNCLVEVAPNNWYEFYCVVVSDIARGVDVHTYTQPVPVPSYVVDIIKNQTPSDYPYLSSGYAVSVGHVMSHSHGFTTSWQEQFGGVCRSDLIKQACVSVAYLYKSRI